MNGKDYRDIAEILRRNMQTHGEEDNGPAFLAVATVTRDLADYFNHDNPDRFDGVRFLRACGLIESSE